MYSHNSRKVIPSQACPGATFTIRVLSYGRRAALAKELLGLDDAAPDFQHLLNQAYLRAMLVSVDGLEVDGVTLGKESFYELAPDALVEEVTKAIEAEVGLTEAETAKSAPPGAPASPGGEQAQE